MKNHYASDFYRHRARLQFYFTVEIEKGRRKKTTRWKE